MRDDESASRSASASLCGLGTRLSCACWPSEPDFDLILCDLMMPEVSGAEVHAEATRARPELARRFIFMTGGAFTLRGRRFLETVNAPIHEKPFSLTRVRELIRERLKGFATESPTPRGVDLSRDE